MIKNLIITLSIFVSIPFVLLFLAILLIDCLFLMPLGLATILWIELHEDI